MNKTSFVIEKDMDGHVVKLVKDSEVWEIDNFNKAHEICDVLNDNTDSGHKYTVVPVGLTVTTRKPSGEVKSETLIG